MAQIDDAFVIPTDDDVYTWLLSSASLSFASKRTYRKQLRYAITRFAPIPTTAVETLSQIWGMLTSFKTVSDNIMAWPHKPASKRCYAALMTSMIKLIKTNHASVYEYSHMERQWADFARETSKALRVHLDSNTLSAAERAAWVDADEWAAKEKEIASSSARGSQEHLLLAMHTPSLIAPLRGGDLWLVRIIHAGDAALDTENTIEWNGVHSAATLVIRSHKTSKTHGPLVRILSPYLNTLLDESLRSTPRAVLFGRKGWALLTPVAWPHVSKEAFMDWKTRTLRGFFGQEQPQQSGARADCRGDGSQSGNTIRLHPSSKACAGE